MGRRLFVCEVTMEKKISGYNIEECADFTEATMWQAQEFYRYMHFDRKEPNHPITILKRHIQFFDADWIGLIDFDLAIESWSTKFFYNAKTESTSETLIEEAESASQAQRWVKAIQNNEPIIIEDIEDIKDEAPEEYAMYKRLKVQSVLGVPYRNCNSGLMVVRNPKKFKTNYLALNIMSYIVTNEIIAQQRRESIERHRRNDLPAGNDEVYIKLFGDMSIASNDLYFGPDDLTSEPTRFLIAFLAINKGRAFGAEQLNDAYDSDKNISWRDIVYKFRTKWKNERQLGNDKYQLVVTTDKGYTLNPELSIDMDLNYADELLKAVDDATDSKAKFELLTKCFNAFCGDFMVSIHDECAIMANYRMNYRRRFLDKMDQYMDLLYRQNDYEAIVRKTSKLLEYFPRNLDLLFWNVMALLQQHKYGIVKSHTEDFQKMLDNEECKMLHERVLQMLDYEKIEDEDTKKSLKQLYMSLGFAKE